MLSGRKPQLQQGLRGAIRGCQPLVFSQRRECLAAVSPSRAKVRCRDKKFITRRVGKGSESSTSPISMALGWVDRFSLFYSQVAGTLGSGNGKITFKTRALGRGKELARLGLEDGDIRLRSRSDQVLNKLRSSHRNPRQATVWQRSTQS